MNNLTSKEVFFPQSNSIICVQLEYFFVLRNARTDLE